MKKFFIGALICSAFILGGCTEKTEKAILFDGFHINAATKYSYQEVKVSTIPGAPFIKQYLQEDSSGFASSIIIAQSKAISGFNLESFAENNNKSLSRKIVDAEVTSTKNITFDCKSQEIDGILQKITIEQSKEKQYLNQFYFVYSGFLYGISTMTQDSKEHSNFAKSIKTISCPSYKQ